MRKIILRLRLSAVLFVTFIFFLGCGQSGGLSGPDQEVVNIAKKELDKILVHCNGHWFYKASPLGDVRIYEITELKPIISSKPLSEAEKLNKVEWDGHVAYIGTDKSSVRECIIQGVKSFVHTTPKDKINTWSEWSRFYNLLPVSFANGFIVFLNKKNGQWEITGGSYTTCLPITCADIPQVKGLK